MLFVRSDWREKVDHFCHRLQSEEEEEENNNGGVGSSESEDDSGVVESSSDPVDAVHKAHNRFTRVTRYAGIKVSILL